MRNNKFLFILIITLISLLFSCNPSNQEPIDDETESKTPDIIEEEPTPSYGGEINISTQNPNTLNPILNTDRSTDQLLKLVFEPLFKLDEKQKPVPNIIKSYELSETGNNILLTLKNDLFWHDSQPIVADDIIFTINQLKDTKTNVVYKKNVENISRVSKVDDFTVRIYFNQPSFMNMYTFLFPIIPKHYYEDNMKIDSETNYNPIGNGMYIFEDYRPMKEVKLVANDNWVNEPPYIKTINAIIINDNETDINAFEQNIIDLLSPSQFNWQNFAEKENISIKEYTSYYYDFIGFNFNNPILNDINVRKAIAYGINREEIISNIFLNHALVTDVPLHPESWLSNNNDLFYDYNEDESKKLLIDAGWIDSDENSLNDENQLSIRLLVNNQDTIKDQVAETIKDNLDSIGFNIEIISVDYETYKTMIVERDFDIVLASWKLSPIPDLSFAFHSENQDIGLNFIDYSDEKMDALLKTAYNSYTDRSTENAYNELLNYVQEQLPYYSLYFKNSATILNGKIYGDLMPNTYNILNGFENLFIYDAENN
ncbi:MAG: peptide ABC transporter substrate-binding protein [bacterium]